MSNIVRDMLYAIVKKTKKLTLMLILVMLLSSVFNIVTIANGDSKPDLIIQSLEFDHTVYEGDNVVVKVLIKNQGSKNIPAGTPIEVELKIDDVQVETNFNDAGLDIGKTCYVNISWKAKRGNELERLLEVVVDYDDKIPEEIEINNFQTSSIFVYEGQVDLKFYGDIIFDGTRRMNEPITIYANITNTGKNTTEDINVTLKIDGDYYDALTINGLLRDEVYTVSFNWIPDNFGTAKINITLDPNNEIDEHETSNNYYEVDVTVRAPRVEWWNTSWHYRKLYKLTGEGNVSISFNSTELLNELNITSNTFENDTVTVVKYFQNGTVECVIGTYFFNESAKELIWEVTGDSYYCAYFDVIENIRGNRSNITEIPDMNESGSVIIDESAEIVEGWWFKPKYIDQFRTYYIPGLSGNQINISMLSMAEVKNATAILSFLDEGIEHIFNLTTGDNLTWSRNYSFFPSEIGNWSIKVEGYDDAGYLSEKFTYDFFVGSPDLVVDSIFIVSGLPEGSLNYADNDYTIKTNILIYNASVDNVNITLKINETYLNSTIENILKNQNNMVNFLWHPEEKGTYEIKVIVDPHDDIDESLSNESNNWLSQMITIEGIPDLNIINITVPSEAVNEGDPAEIFVNIINIGEGNATNYTVNLYLEQHKFINDMEYKGLKSQTIIDINITDEPKNISIVWESAQYGEPRYNGEWNVGVIVVWDDVHPDSNPDNNRKCNNKSRLKVNKTEPTPQPETNAPVIEILEPEPLEKIEQNLPVKIIAKITDESSIKSVNITITSPNRTSYTFDMIKQDGDKYSYIFENTHILNTYNFKIIAVDEHNNTKAASSKFTIVEDATPPEIEYIGVLPSVQLKDGDVTISSIVSDRSGVKFVQITITYPNSSSETKNMTNSPGDKKYYFTQSYEMLGRYVFYITTEDTLENKKTTKNEEVDFWITIDLEDTDSDGMPDWWEEKYGFDPFDPTDADEDEDDDGYTNVEEYEDGTNPLKPLSLLERIVNKSKENWIYALVSGILFIVLIALSMYGFFRRKT